MNEEEIFVLIKKEKRYLIALIKMDLKDADMLPDTITKEMALNNRKALLTAIQNLN